jgi:hypothetical protein
VLLLAESFAEMTLPYVENRCMLYALQERLLDRKRSWDDTDGGKGRVGNGGGRRIDMSATLYIVTRYVPEGLAIYGQVV